MLDALSGKTEKEYTIANDSFLSSAQEWEKLQNPEKIRTKILHLLDTIIEEFPEIGIIGLTGQMHGIVYLNRRGECVSPLYTWQDGRGNHSDATGKSLCDSLQEKYGMKAFAGYGLVTHLYNEQHGMVPKDEILVNFFQNCASAMGVDGFDPYSFTKKMLGVEELYNHKTLEERAKKFNGELNLDGEFQWGESVGREVW